MSSDKIFPDRSINIFHCLMELNDHSVHWEIQEFLKSETRSEQELSEIQCSALAYMLQMSEEVLDELDLKNTPQELPPADGQSSLSDCGLSETHCEVMASALKSKPSHLRKLDLGYNTLQDSGVKLLCAGLESPHCCLETLRSVQVFLCFISTEVFNVLLFICFAESSNWIDVNEKTVDLSPSFKALFYWEKVLDPKCRLSHCSLSETSCASLASALESNPSHLRELDLSDNKLQDPGAKKLCGFLESPRCRLETLRLNRCRLSETSCASLASALNSNPSHLRELDLIGNHLQDPGVKQLCGFLESPHCRLETLRLRGCRLSETSCASLASALKSNLSHLRQLDLIGNDLQDQGVKQLCGFLESPHCRLESLR
uniref:NACHT LRR and PYD domain-containing protein n=1 Tax=Monopterus albus TaxID=43700 RepID=A0A3Q3Q0Q8_MONAL